jgi:uncharacterized membrane protein
MACDEEVLKELREEKKELESLEMQVSHLRERLLDRVPEHFSKRDVVNAFFGSLTIGITFILKGATLSTALNLDLFHLELVIVATLLILFTEIYFIGYSRVKDKNSRRFGQFMTKRLIALYSITIITSLFLVYLLNMNNNPMVRDPSDIVKIVVLVSFPCAIGAAVPSLLRKY